MKYILLLFFSFIVIQSLYSQSVNNMTLLGHKNEFTSGGTPTGWYYSSCWGWTAPNGREYAIVGFYGGTIWYDITDPSNIVRCDTIYGPGSFYNYREMATYSHYCYIVSEGGLGVQIVDMQYLPDSVHLVQNYMFPGYTRSHTIRADGRFLYCNGGTYNNGGVFILDLLDPENPVKRGQWGTRYVHDCHVRNDTIYAACINNSNLTVIDATNKDSLKQVTFWTYPGAVTHNAWTTKNADYLVTTDEGGSNHAKVWDIEDIMNPIQVADINPYEPTMVHNAYVKGDTLYLSHYRAGVIVYDISTPESPSEIGHYDTYPGSGTAYQGSWNVYPYFASGKIITADISTGLYVFKMGSSVGISNNNGTLPAEYKLAQNYPNPFNPETKISYSLPVNTDVKLLIYNALGKELANYTYANQQAGTHEITWSAKDMSSGIYFYKITAGNFSETKKMMLVR